MNQNDASPGRAILSLSNEQRHCLADLLQRERDKMCRWWTHLNELRCRGELPDWAFKNGVGTGLDHDEWLEAVIETNEAIFGKKMDIRSPVERPKLQTFINEDDEPRGKLENLRVKVLKRVKQPGAVRQHRPSKSTLGSTNARA